MRRWLAAAAVALIGAEGLARVALDQPAVETFLRVRGDAGARVALLHEAQHAVPGTGTLAVYEPHPRLGWAPVPGATDGQRHFDPQGLRVTPTRPDGPVLMVVGGAFALGDEVEDGEAWPAVLAEARPDRRVLNGAVGSYAADQAMLRLDDTLLAMGPEVVVYQYTDLDITRAPAHTGIWFKPWFTLEDGALTLHGVPVPGREEALARYRLGPRLLDVVDLVVQDQPGRDSSRAWPLVEALLDRMARSCAERGARLAVVLGPTDREVSPPPGAFLPREANLANLQRWCDASGTPCLDLLPAFTAEPDPEALFAPEGHWSARGNRVAAAAIEAFLVDADLLPRDNLSGEAPEEPGGPTSSP